MLSCILGCGTEIDCVVFFEIEVTSGDEPSCTRRTRIKESFDSHRIPGAVPRLGDFKVTFEFDSCDDLDYFEPGQLAQR
jgi:hypothetical protein